jgi:hypothetical protein
MSPMRDQMVICIQEGKTIYHSRIYMEGNIGDNYGMEVYILYNFKIKFGFPASFFSSNTDNYVFLEQ